MKKYIILGIVMLGVFFIASQVEAVTIVIGPNKEEIRHRYGGSFVVNDNGITEEYWYITPDASERFLIKDGNSLSSVLRLQGQGISNQNLDLIPTEIASPTPDFQFLYESRGMIYLQVENNGEAWYVHPLDNLRYEIYSGNRGFTVVKNIAIDISASKLDVIPISSKSFAREEDSINFGIFETVVDTLKSRYYQPENIDNNDLMYGALRGLTSSIDDPYTEYFTPKEKDEFDSRLEGELEGIGAVVEVKSGYIHIVSPLDDSPAMNAGLLPGDLVISVDGENIEGYTLDEGVDLIRGPAGTTVRLEIRREGRGENFFVDVQRQRIELKAVEASKEDDIAYFRINLFGEDVVSEFTILQEQLLDHNTKGIIIDLRNNPGGLTNQSAGLADFWLPKGATIVRELFRTTFYDYTAQTPELIDIPTIILVNEGTASASEIFTLALTEHGKAQSLGVQTYGKGTGQYIENYEDGSALKYTTFVWQSPHETTLENGEGLTPDFIVENTEDFDAQLHRARQILR